VVGTLAKEDVKIVFNFHIPRLDAASQAVINPASGDDVLSKNIAWVTADWQPADARDAAQAVSSDSKCVPGGICQPLHTLQDKSIAIQKTVTDLTDGNPSPGDVLEYTLSFQVSDYFAFNSVVVSDLISDGQHVQDSFTPVLQIDGNGYALPTAVISPVNYDVACNYTGGPGPECTLNNPSADDGATRLEFRVSNEIVTRGQNGRLIGGCVNPAGGLLPVCTSASRGAGATTGTITFRSVILENFANNYPSGDRSVDQGDLFSDLTNIHGLVLNNNTFAPGQPEDDDATAEISIGRKNLSKSIYAVNGLTNSSAWQTDSGGNVVIKPGDTLTYRLSYSLNTSDVENLALDDYLPLPVFFAGDPDANDNTAPKHDDGPVFVFDDVTGATPPAVGHAQFGPGDTFRAYSGIVPTIGRNLPANTLSFNYGDFDDPRDQSTVLDVLFTLTVSSEPFADSLFIMNDVHEKEGSTNNGDFAQDALVGVVLTQPALATTKGVIWTSSSAAVFNPVVRGPVSFYGPASAPRWTGLINSAGLAAHPIDSNIGGVRGGDIVSFAIAIENKGSSLEGAFDLVIRDAIPGIFQIPTGGLNLQIYYGNGSGPINTEVDGVVKTGDCGGGGFGDPCGPDGQANTPDDIFGNGIKLVDPVGSGVCQAYNPNLGNNVILLTYDLQVKPNLKPGTYTNTARISNYSGYEGGSGHVSSGDTVWNYLVADTAETAWITSGGIASAGFAPRRISHLPDQPANLQYQDMTGTWLEIPSLKLKLPVMAVPMTRAGWDLDWLSNQAGYLQGTTPPGALGNTALAAHVYLADGQPGPFIDLRQMSWGQSVILHHDGYRYLYEVRQNQRVLPSDLSVFDEDGYAWLTLLTCQDYSETSHTYLYRTAVRAVLLKVEKE
jgi:LPXTG-site transpeptidase (sortase) family protein